MNNKGEGKWLVEGLGGFTTVAVVGFIALIFLLGPANLVLFFKSPGLYAIVIGVLLAMFAVKRLD